MDMPTLLIIASKGGLERPVQLSSSQLALDLKSSQQTASRRLKNLEDEGIITREIRPRGQTVRITSKGKEMLGGIYHDLSQVFGREPQPYTICGTITSGMGEGEYYMRMEEYSNQFEEKLGFKPYPGTLNLRLRGQEDIRTRQNLTELPGITINGFKNEGRTFGSVKCFKAIIEEIEGAVIIPSRTHHSADTIEVISNAMIKKELSVKEGNRLCVRVRVG
jgi:riboflavin kinase